MTTRQQARQQWLQRQLDTADFKLAPASEDASFRSYHRVTMTEQSYILMDAPPEHEDCRPFIDISERLYACNLNVPVIHAQDLSQGFLLLSDLGDELYLPHLDSAKADRLYKAAIDALVVMQLGANTENLPAYDQLLLNNEMQLFPEWLLASYLKLELDITEQKMLDAAFNLLIKNALEQPQVFVHRDYHSRNLMLTSLDTPGIIDYQDAVLGAISYDLVSLLKDSYIYWQPEQRKLWIDYYLEQLHQSNSQLAISEPQFLRWFDLMGVQRELKVAGIFARLYLRDRKEGFLADMPRTLTYITELGNTYSELGDLIDFISNKVAPAMEVKLCAQ